MSFVELCVVAILAGGMGTRLKSRTGGLPKPMAPILGKPVLEHQIELCKRYGFCKIALLVHYESHSIRSYFGDGSRFGVELTYVVEEQARGTAGALRDALPVMADRFLVLYGDTFADVNLKAIWNKSHLSSIDGTLLIHPNDHPNDSDLVEIDRDGRIIDIHPYPHPEHAKFPNLVNAALYVLRKSALTLIVPKLGKSDLAKQTFPAMLSLGLKLQAYITQEYIKDMGTPERLDKVESDIIKGLPERLSDRHLRSAVFLDRDGTINEEVNHLTNPDKLKLIAGAGVAVRALNRAGVLAVGITNQPVLARGDVTWEELDQIHAKLDQLLGESKAYLDALYVCPHHPDKGFEGEISDLKIECECRKPKTGLIDRAVADLSINRRYSWFVGDSSSDIEAGKRAGLRTVLVRTGFAGLDGKYSAVPDYVAPDLQAAVEFILHGYRKISSDLFSVCAQAVNSRLVLIGGCARVGKSTVANVLKEMIVETGRQAHVISLDGWLKPAEHRTEGQGVVARYDMREAVQTIASLSKSKTREMITLNQYERKSREFINPISLSIGPDDLVIVEGVTALLDKDLLGVADVKVFVDEMRIKRLKQDYAWRGWSQKDFDSIVISREEDEVPLIRASAINASHQIVIE